MVGGNAPNWPDIAVPGDGHTPGLVHRTVVDRQTVSRPESMTPRMPPDRAVMSKNAGGQCLRRWAGRAGRPSLINNKIE